MEIKKKALGLCAALAAGAVSAAPSLPTSSFGFRPTTDTVFDGHKRFVLDPGSLPEVGRLVFEIGDPGKQPEEASCTATLVGVRLVLTAAHCVFETLDYNQQIENGGRAVSLHGSSPKPRTIYFFPDMLNGKVPSGAKKIGADMDKTHIGDFDGQLEISANNIAQAIKQAVQETPTDYALLDLESTPTSETISNLGSIPLDPEKLEVGVSLIAIGYSGDFHDADSAGVDNRCHVRKIYDNGTIFHDCAIEEGASGGPLLTETINGTRLTSDNEDQLRDLAKQHPDQVKISYAVAGIITSEFRTQRSGSFAMPGPFGKLFGLDDGDDDSGVQYSDTHPNVANGAVNFASLVASAVEAEQDAGISASGTAPGFQELKAASSSHQPKPVDPGDGNGDDDGDGNDWAFGGAFRFPR